MKCSSLSLLIFDVKRNIKEEIFLDDVAGIQFDTDSVSFFISIRRDSDSREDIRFDLDTISVRLFAPGHLKFVLSNFFSFFA